MNWSSLLDLASGAGQTQRDINVLANTAEQFQSPSVQSQLQEAKTLAETYATITLMLNVVTTVAIVGTFLIQIQNQKKGRRK